MISYVSGFLIRLDCEPGEVADQPRRRGDLLRGDAHGGARARFGELGRPRPEGHDDLLERRVAGALTEAVDRDLDLAGAGLDGGERVRRGEAEVVVAVDAHGRLVADEIGDAPDERAELGRDRVAHRVRDVDGRRAGVDHGLVDLQEELRVGPGRVLGAELDLGVRPEPLAAVADPADRLGEGLVARQAELVDEVDVARRDEHVEVRPLGDRDRVDGALRIAVAATGQRRDGDPALRFLGDPPHRLEVAGRRGREARLDDVDLHPRELPRDLQLLGGGQAGTGRLLAVAEGGVEDPDAAVRDERRHQRAPSATAVRAVPPPSPPDPVALACAWPARTSTGSRNGIWARSRAPTRSTRWS
jgi:hypothetical protein